MDRGDRCRAKGSTLVRSRGTAPQIPRNLGGLSCATEAQGTTRATENGGTTGKRDTTLPWTDTRGRQAMHHAMHRDARRKVLDKGRATPIDGQGFSPDVAGWDPTWEHRCPELYGSDVRAAQRLLAAARDPHGFPAQAWLFPCAGAPARIPLMAAVQIQWREVGSVLELEATDWVAKGRPTLRERKVQGSLDALPPPRRRSRPRSRPSTRARPSCPRARPLTCPRGGRTWCRGQTRRDGTRRGARSAPRRSSSARASPSSRWGSRWSWTLKSSTIGPSPGGMAAPSATPG